MDQDIPPFEDKDEEIQFLRDYICQLQQDLDDAKQDTRRVERDFEEFQENSRLLEKELETALDQSEKSNRELRTSYNRLQAEQEKLRERADQIQRLLDLRDSELSKYKASEEELVKRTRELEQRNDDLERALRAMSMSKGETESKLNAAIERDALLECEQEELLAMVQRLKDEKRDLYHELKIRDKYIPDNDKCVERGRSPIDSNKLMVEIETQTAATGSPLKMRRIEVGLWPERIKRKPTSK
ncbi:nuclear distribution protein nudE-like 1-A isoform X2 [Anabrus simplex]|uniref:nuclear distribution protein nudE-like 1-A isoform X2 n=1 Tax=Anabrus simplex TaxID=316456 RepID=UPI0034DCC67B